MKKPKDDKQTLSEQLKLIRAKLEEEGSRIPSEDLIVEYDNGGGQCGVRENPFFVAYEKLLASYTKALAAYKNLAGENDAEIDDIADVKKKFKLAK